MARRAAWVIVGDGYCTEVTLEGQTVRLVHRARDTGEQTLVMSGLHAAQDVWLVLGEAVRHLSKTAGAQEVAAPPSRRRR